ncbi:MAG: lytic transglycosylase domain-containing protein, partial [Bdellovibrionales bacterium]|nr:lytic transglycosylase domain-containing protein [Bdellovibrionales bacterium]
SDADSDAVAESENDESGEVMPGDEDEKVLASDFRDPKLRERFKRANNLVSIGRKDWAKWELFEIERRTSNKTYLKMLMEAYSQLGFYNRTAYISEIYFSTERNRGGVAQARELWQYNYPQAYEKNVSNYASRFNVSESLVLAIMRAESHFNSEAYSPVGARGLMQIMPYTASQIARLLGEGGVTELDLLVPETNIRLGSRYLSRLQKKFQDQIPLVAAGYNAGPHRVYSWLNTFGTLDMDEFIEHVPFVETRNYMKKVVRNYAIYNALYGSKNDTFVWLTQPVPMRVSARPSPRENWDIID